jgi:hypothetical protein
MMKDISTMFRLQARRYYSPEHIKAAAFFTRQSHQLEDSYMKNGVVTEELIDNHRSYVTGAIFAAVSFLEATLNELFIDTVEYQESQVTKNIDPSTKLLLAEMWKLEIPRTARYPILEKFQIALTLARKPFDTNTVLYQDIKILITIRNELTHFELVWERGEDFALAKDKKILKGLQRNKPPKFALNPLLTGRTIPFFPDKCLSHGCAEWAVKRSIEFVKLFSSEIGSTLLFDENNPSLKTQL